MARTRGRPSGASQVNFPPKPRLTEYWDLGAAVNIAIANQPSQPWIRVARGFPLAKDSLRIAAYFAEYFTRAEAVRLQNTGMPWRNVLELVRPETPADRRRLYRFATTPKKKLTLRKGKKVKFPTKEELAKRAAKFVKRLDTPRLSKTDALKFLDRLAKDLKRIIPIAQQAEQVLQDDHDTKKWRKAKVKTAGANVMDLIDTASDVLSTLRSTIKKKTGVR